MEDMTWVDILAFISIAVVFLLIISHCGNGLVN